MDSWTKSQSENCYHNHVLKVQKFGKQWYPENPFFSAEVDEQHLWATNNLFYEMASDGLYSSIYITIYSPN